MESNSETKSLTVEDYLRGAVAYDIPDNALLRILHRRGIAPGSSVDSLTEQQEDLATADVYVWCATAPTVRNATEDADGDWKHKEGGWQASANERRMLHLMAKDLYDKWGETLPGKSVIRIVNL